MGITINFLAVLVAAVVAFVFGALWHGPLFGKQWIALVGMTDRQMKEARAQGMAKIMVIAFIAQLVTAYVMALFAGAWGVSDALGALHIAFWAWLGFIATTLLNGVLWERRSMNLYLFNIAYHLLSLFLVSLVVVLWK